MCRRSGRATLRRTRYTSIRRAAALLALFLAACGTATADRDPAAASPRGAATNIDEDLAALLDASAEAWNAGDLDGFISDYAADATFVGSRGLIRGADAIRQLYAEGYWASGAPPDALRFEILDARATGRESAVGFGRYILYDRATGATTGTGHFTLVLRRIDGSWKIVHDHSSAESS